MEELRLFLDRWNITQCRVFALVTGRTAVVQASRGVLKLSAGQELEVLPFMVSESAIKARRSTNLAQTAEIKMPRIVQHAPRGRAWKLPEPDPEGEARAFAFLAKIGITRKIGRDE